MSNIWIEVLTQIVRGMLTALGVYLVKRGWVESGLWSKFVVEAAPGIVVVIVGVAWIMAAEFRKRRETLVARELPPGTSLHIIGQRAKSAIAPSATMRLVLIPLIMVPMLAIQACAGWVHTATVANHAFATGLDSLSQEVDKGHDRDCDTQRPGLQRCITDKDWQRLRDKEAAAARIGIAFTDAIGKADKQAATAQASALLTFVQDVATNELQFIPTDVRVIVSAALNGAQVALAAFAPTPPAAAPPLEK